MSSKAAFGQIRIEVEGIEKAIAQIKAYQGKAQIEAENALQDGAKAIMKKAKARVPVRSGRLKRSGRTRFQRNKMLAQAAFYAPHAHLVEFGAKATTVKPKRAKALEIVDGGHGILRYAQKARIPTRREKPFLVPSALEEFPKIEKRIEGALKKV